MAVRDILLLGNPVLLNRSKEITPNELELATEIGTDLHDTINAFRNESGWGRAISAPQIGKAKRVIFLHVERPWLIINPEMSDMSEETIEIWDDCMSFPDLLVKVRRHESFTLTFRDEKWEQQSKQIDGILSELLQHEIDHLDGVLAVSRAIDENSFALQSQRELLQGAVFANK